MAEQDIHQHTTADAKERETRLTNMDHVSASNENKQEGADVALNVKFSEASSSACTDREAGSEGCEDPEQVDFKNDDSSDEKMVPLEEASSSPNEASPLNVVDISTSPQADDRGQGDHSSETAKDEPLATIDEMSSEGSIKLLEDLQSLKSNDDSSDEKMVPLEEASSSPNEASPLNVVDISTSPQADDRGQGDHSSETAKDEPLATIDEMSSEGSIKLLEDLQSLKSNEYHPGENKATKSSAATLDDRRSDQLDGPNARNNEETSDINSYGSHPAEDDERCLDIQENTTSQQTVSPQIMSEQDGIDGQGSEVETIGPTTQETPEATLPVVTGRPAENGSYLLAVVATTVIVAVVAILAQRLLQPEHPPHEEDTRQVIFLKQMEKLKTQFPNQRSELWVRSKIHLLRHLQTAQPTEPVSLILTSGVRAESTLACLAQGLASAFSAALNASVLHIDGASEGSQDSDQVKLDIDRKLQGAFEGDKPVAVIHRFEELPPGSTLIFYRYCDHENAAFKKTFLIFTVLLEEEEIPAQSRLSTVEEMVDDQLQRKFLSEGHPVSFDRMDLDKYGGLWSRISHLILPVTTELRTKHEECKGHE